MLSADDDGIGYLEGQIVGGRRLRVELWDITAPPPILLTRNYEPAGSSNLSYQTQEVARLAQDQSSWIAISPTSPASSSSSAYSTAPVPPVTYTSPPMQVVPQYVVQAMPSALQSQQQTQAYYAQAQLTALRNQQAQQIAAQQARVQSTPYATSSSGLPVNMRNGGAVTEYRAVFVNRLNYKTTERDIMGLFSKAGKIVSCKLVKESKTQKSRGHAQIEYDTAAEAQRAVDLFNEKPFQGMSLIVRLDKNATTVSPPPRSDSRPVIVDSSVASRASPAVLDGFQRLSLN